MRHGHRGFPKYQKRIKEGEITFESGYGNRVELQHGKVEDGEYLLVAVGEGATEAEKKAMWNYELYTHRYDKRWLDEHGVVNALCG